MAESGRLLPAGSATTAARRPLGRNRLVPIAATASLSILLVSASLLIAAPPTVAAPTGTAVSLGAGEPPVEIVRCHLAEGRIVVRHGGRLHVLHAGEALDGTGLRLVEVSAEAATLVVVPPPPGAGWRLLRVTAPRGGPTVVRELSTDPADVERAPAGVPLGSPHAHLPTRSQGDG